MIREYIIILSKKKSDKLAELAENDGFDDDLAWLQLKIDELIGSGDGIAKALAKGLKDDSARLTRTEK
jgi:hypothetical protein